MPFPSYTIPHYCSDPFFPLRSFSLSTSYDYHPSLHSPSLFPAIRPAARRPRWWAHMDYSTRRHCRKDTNKVIVIMGATGTGKSRLSIDLATLFFPSEIINSDKIQVYKDLDITTNKIPLQERLGVPHHLLGEFDSSSDTEFTPSDFRSVASSLISDISSRRKLPLLVGGSNSFIHALLVDRFDPDSDVFDGTHSVSSELRYNCCFLWVDVSFAVLSEYLCMRVDDMLESGMFDELAEFYDPDDDDDSVTRTGIRKAIGVPEFNRYFRKFPPEGWRGTTMMIDDTNREEDVERRVCYEEAVKAIKDNTCQLAKRQIGKILRLRDAGWDLRRLDATEVFRAAMVAAGGSRRTAAVWEKQVLEPSVKIVKSFLEE